jgi:hypothetical protein
MILLAFLAGAVAYAIFWVASTVFETVINQSLKESKNVDEQ